MHSLRLLPAFALCLFLAAALSLLARGEEVTSTLKFSQPDQPGTVRIQLARGSLSVRGADVAEVTVISDTAPATKSPRRDGLRVLTSSSSFALTEKDNVITLNAGSDGSGSRAARFDVTVPRQTAIVVQNTWGGDIRCAGLAGDIEINNLNGAIRLEDVSGGIVASTMNGEIHASVRELREGKPLSFQSMNGEIVVRLVGDAKANIRVRTQNGSVLTDFDEAALVTRTEAATGTTPTRSHMVVHTQTLLAPEAREAIREAARVGAEAAREAATALREAVEAAREGAEAARARSGPSRQALDGEPPAPPAAPRAPRPPKAMSIPTITGGKLVTGTLNGGGPEISIATMNGDVTLRRLERK